MREIVIRPFQSIADYRGCEFLQQAVWRFPDREVVPLNELMGVARSHGLLLGAFLGRKMVGFVFGIHGVRPKGDRHPGGRIFHVSRMLAVHPRYQRSGVGFHLKCAQRRWCLDQGFTHATWTFDPLQTGNANLNIARLGAVSDTYLVNVYGRSESELNRGMDTDRLQVDWEMGSARVLRRVLGRPDTARYPDVRFANECGLDRRGLLVPVRGRVDPCHPRAAVEIPPRIVSLMQQDLPLARRWRRHVRTLLQGHFARGYRIVDFVCTPRDGREALAYVLAHR